MERSAADSWEDKADNSSSATTPEEEDSMEIDEDGAARPKVYHLTCRCCLTNVFLYIGMKNNPTI